jgi:hypothetical protein
MASPAEPHLATVQNSTLQGKPTLRKNIGLPHYGKTRWERRSMRVALAGPHNLHAAFGWASIQAATQSSPGTCDRRLRRSKSRTNSASVALGCVLGRRFRLNCDTASCRAFAAHLVRQPIMRTEGVPWMIVPPILTQRFAVGMVLSGVAPAGMLVRASYFEIAQHLELTPETAIARPRYWLHVMPRSANAFW